jgi:hypothetical protein
MYQLLTAPSFSWVISTNKYECHWCMEEDHITNSASLPCIIWPFPLISTPSLSVRAVAPIAAGREPLIKGSGVKGETDHEALSVLFSFVSLRGIPSFELHQICHEVAANAGGSHLSECFSDSSNC